MWTAQGLPWVTAPNLTPDPETGIGRASDDAIARAIREGVGIDGHAVFALMPYEEFRRIPDEDVAAIVVYLRSLPPVRNPLPRTAMPFPLNEDLRSVFAYLRTLAPVAHVVTNGAEASACPVCGLEHGGGDRNARSR